MANHNPAHPKRHHAFECIALLLQGGGALGAYQAGVYQALSEAGLEPDWVAGISIGAINAAIIAGNKPKERVPKLRQFWETVTMNDFRYYPAYLEETVKVNTAEHQLHNFASALRTFFYGVPGFFRPRPLVTLMAPVGMLTASSFYDTKELQSTLERLVDFDRINSDDIHFNVGAVNVTSGNFVDFDNKQCTIKVEHVMASGALPPGLPPVKIGDEYYWDGGLISNTPLQWVVDNKSYQDSLVFQVDLWSAAGEYPQNLADTYTRKKDIQYSSRTRANTDRFKERHKARHTIARLIDKLPEELRRSPEVKLLSQYADRKVYNIVHLIYHNKSYEGYSKDFEFSRMSMDAHWQSGYEDTVRTLKNPKILQRPETPDGIAIFDAGRQDKKTAREDRKISKETKIKHAA